MHQIVLYGDQRDHQLGCLLQSCLERDFTVNSFRDSAFQTGGRGAPLNLIETDCVKKIELKSGLLIFKRNAKAEHLHQIGEAMAIVVDSMNVSRLSKLRGSPVYTCGFGSKDTITFSSREPGSAVVSLQRAVVSAHETICEPFEIPCVIQGDFEDYTILAGVMAMILIRNLDEKKSKDLGKIYFS